MDSSINSEGVSMTLSDKVPALLDKCAHALVAGKECSLDLTALFPTFYQDNGMIKIVGTLIERVEYFSDGARTVRLANKAMFRHRIKNTGLYLVCCAAGTPKGIVTEFCDDMVLAMLRPCGNGLTVGAERASNKNTSVNLGLALEAHFESR